MTFATGIFSEPLLDSDDEELELRDGPLPELRVDCAAFMRSDPMDGSEEELELGRAPPPAPFTDE